MVVMMELFLLTAKIILIEKIKFERLFLLPLETKAHNTWDVFDEKKCARSCIIYNNKDCNETACNIFMLLMN